MYDLPKNSIASYLSNPLTQKMDFGSVHISELSREIQNFKKTHKNVSPESDALSFYFINHLFHTVKSKFNGLEKLNDDVIDMSESYIKMTSEISKRLFYYQLLICVEEARFLQADNDDYIFEYLSNYNQGFAFWAKDGFKGKLSDFGKLDINCGVFADALLATFAFGKWSSGYGGKGWTPIASSIADCIHGNTSFEQMADQAFSLCHNNGSMFNKGHLYNYYSHFIYTILDIQDSGQIPQWIGNNLNNQYITKELKNLYKKASILFPDEMTGKVNKKLITDSQHKREKKEKQLAKQQQKAWNNGLSGGNSNKNDKPKLTEKDKINNAILKGLV